MVVRFIRFLFGWVHCAEKINHYMIGFFIIISRLGCQEYFDVIEEIGPGQSFLMHEYTFAKMRSKSKAEICDRRTRDAWLDLVSGKTAAEMAAEKAIEIMDHHHPPPLLRGAEETKDEMVGKFEARLRSECGD